MAQPIRFKATVESIQLHNTDVVSFKLRAEKRLPRFIPGQFIHLALDEYEPSGFWPESRVFSVANAVADRRTVELTVSRQGAYTSRIIDQIEPNLSVWCKGPYGDFYLDGGHGCSRTILIAGGTGITPFCALMDSAIVLGTLPVNDVVLYYGARTTDLLIYRELTEQCVKKVEGFQARYYVEETPKTPNDNLVMGRLQLDVIMPELGNIDDTAFYLSGPKTMINTFRHQLLNDYGLPEQRVLIDAWE